MIDVESEIFTAIRADVVKQFDGLYITGEYVPSPPIFPCVSVVEIDNVPLQRTQTTDSVENYAVLVYEINVYSNKKTGKKAECKTIAKVIDDSFAKLGFTRMMLNPIQNLEDATIYRMVGRYRAIMDKNKTTYRR